MFQVPEEFRVKTGPMKTTKTWGNNGYFVVPSPFGGGKRRLLIIASDGEGWEHVSIHVIQGEASMTPIWDEMHYVKKVFWDSEDVVMQLHPKASEYVNNQPNTLHLWRPVGVEIPTPPSILVGVK